MENQISDNTIKRDTSYDWLRLIGTILVVVGHSRYLSIQTTFGGVDYRIPAFASRVYSSFPFRIEYIMSTWVYGFHMALFFMLSGAVFAIKPVPKFKNVVISKSKRLLIPYLFYGYIFMFPIKYLGGFYDLQALRSAVLVFPFGTDSGHLWFLLYLFLVFIVFLAVIKLCERLRVDSVFIPLLICAVISVFIKLLPFEFFSVEHSEPFLMWFAIGYAFEKIKKKGFKANTFIKLLGIIALLLLEYFDRQQGIFNYYFRVLAGCILCYLIASVLSELLPKAAQSKAFKILVGTSFYVYIFHDPLEYLVLKVFMNTRLLESALGCWLYIFSRTVVIYMISTFLGMLVLYVKKRVSKKIA